MSWGSMNSFALTAVPLFILMAEIMQHSGLSFRIYRGLSKLVCVIPGGLLQTIFSLALWPDAPAGAALLDGWERFALPILETPASGGGELARRGSLLSVDLGAAQLVFWF